jgi:O-antigen biosynthesis protein WbqP
MYLKLKRLIDIVISILGLVFLLPIFLLIIIAIKIDSPGPVLFKQKRAGNE